MGVARAYCLAIHHGTGNNLHIWSVWGALLVEKIFVQCQSLSVWGVIKTRKYSRWPRRLRVTSIHWCTPPSLRTCLSSTLQEVSSTHSTRNQSSHAIRWTEPKLSRNGTYRLPSIGSPASRSYLHGCGSCRMQTPIWSQRWDLAWTGLNEILLNAYDSSYTTRQIFLTEHWSKRVTS